MNKLVGSLDVQDHHVEHQLAAVQDHIKNLIGKIQAREDKSESRIENLEALVKKVRIINVLLAVPIACALLNLCLCVIAIDANATVICRRYWVAVGWFILPLCAIS